MRLLDANVYITAKNTYYSLDVFPMFWDWLDDRALALQIASTDMVFDELCDQDDDLAAWAKDRRASMFHVNSTSSKDVTDRVSDIGKWMRGVPFPTRAQEDFMDGADPFLVAAAAVGGHSVVTAETFDAQIRRKVKVPNACAALGVAYETTFQMLKNMGAKFN
jgi:hypothetical protein